MFFKKAGESDCPVLSIEGLEFPRKHELYGDFLIVPEDAFLSEGWQKALLSDSRTARLFFKWLAGICNVRIIARKARITVGDDMRRPRLVFLHLDAGTDDDDENNENHNYSHLVEGYESSHLRNPNSSTWVQTTQFGVIYSWNPAQVMFSAGNISEKQRVFRTFRCEQETVVDLYAGIGYFTLPYLKGAKAKFVYACEMNPDSMRALQRNLQLNRISADRYRLLPGDHHEHKETLRAVAQRVNMGFLPRCDASFDLAISCIDPATGGFIHLHENIMESELEKRKSEILNYFSTRYRRGSVTCEHVEKVKSYAPRVFHYVLDLKLSM